MIRLEHVTRSFPGPDAEPVRAVAGIDLAVAEGETLCLIGPSGCGKTTTLKLINRLVEAEAGRVLVRGRDVRDVDAIALRRGMGYVVQGGALFPHLTVAANVGLLCRLEGWDEARARQRTDELLELVALAPRTFAARYPRELSGGQRQRVGVARALALDPPIVLMDEPFGALDPGTRRELQDETLRLRERAPRTTVIVTHDLDEAFRLGDRVALLREGRVAQVGTPAELRARPASEFVARFLERELRA